jgi:hypothetical protein
MAFSAVSRPLTYEARFVFEPVNGTGTRIVVNGTGRMHGIWRLVEPLLAGDIKKEEGNELRTIKAILESGPLPHGGSANATGAH